MVKYVLNTLHLYGDVYMINYYANITSCLTFIDL